MKMKHIENHINGSAKIDGKATTTQNKMNGATTNETESNPPQPASVALTTPDKTVREIADEICSRMKEDGRARCMEGYLAEARALLRLSGPLADAVPGAWTVEHCCRIRDARLTELDQASASPMQAMRNTRYVLGQVDGLPTGAIEVFCVPHRKRHEPIDRASVLFTPVECRLMFDHLAKATWTQKGLFLLGANGIKHLQDVVVARWEQLAQTKDGINPDERVKNGNPFAFEMWPETKTWAEERPHRPDDIYIFPDLVFSERELAGNPVINQVPLSDADERKRLSIAAARARKCFLEFMRAAGIDRKDASFRSFRHTNISLWHASGVPSRVGMAAAGIKNEQDYLGFVQATASQLADLAKLTLHFYKHGKDSNNS